MKVLLIRLRLIGDVVFTTPVIRALKRALPDAQISYLVEREAASVVAGNPHLAEVIVIPRTRGLSRLAEDARLAARLRRRRFDLVIDMHGGPRSSLLTLATGAPQRIGYRIPGRTWMYTRAVARPRELRPRHSVLNQWDLLHAIEGVNAGVPDPSRDAVEMPLRADVDARVERRLAAAGVLPGHELIVVHVSAGNPFRRWPIESFVELAVQLAAANSRRRILLTSGPSEQAAARRVAEAARARLNSALQVPETSDFSLAELRALVDRAAVYIGGDSGPLHVASASTAPIVGLFGPTLAERSMPWRDHRWFAEAVDAGPLPCRPCNQRECVTNDFRCLTMITAQQVIAAAERALDRQGHKR
jgi:lipopolysaccharide heptosyltransferase II